MSLDDPLFLFGFIPFVVLACAILRRWAPGLVTPALILASAGFYLSTDPVGALVMFPLILATILGIEALSRWPRWGRAIAVAVTMLNLLLLAAWKYNPQALLTSQPFGLSFVVFLNISAIIDVHTGRAAKISPAQQFLYSGFFATVSAGPISRFKDLAPQLERLGHLPVSQDQIATGLMLCVVGLAKAVIIGRPLLVQVFLVIQAVTQGADIALLEAWFTVLAAFVGLYFVFSGYSDMAIGVGSSLGLQLAVNFNSPLKSNTAAEFFQRWHISLSKWVEVYVFAPLSRAVSRLPYGSSRNRRIVAWAVGTVASTTMIAAWHGANGFLALAGTFMGVWLIINQLPSLIGKARPRRERGVLGRIAYRVFFIGTTAPIGFVYFAGDADSYWAILGSLLDVTKLSLPGALAGPLGFLGSHDVRFDGIFAIITHRAYWVTHLAMALGLALWAPNTMEIFGFAKARTWAHFNLNASFRTGLALGLLTAISISFLSIGQGFVYDDF